MLAKEQERRFDVSSERCQHRLRSLVPIERTRLHGKRIFGQHSLIVAPASARQRRGSSGRRFHFSAKAARDLMSSRAADREGVGDRCSYAAAFSASRICWAVERGGKRSACRRERAKSGWARDSRGDREYTFLETEGITHPNRGERKSNVQREGKPRRESTKKRRLSGQVHDLTTGVAK